MTSPESIAHHANAPLGVCRLLFAVAESDEEVVRLIRSAATDQETVRLRRAVIWASKFHTCASLPEIGRALNRDHSSVLRSLEETKVIWLADPTFRHLCDRAARDARPGSTAAVRSAEQFGFDLQEARR